MRKWTNLKEIGKNSFTFFVHLLKHYRNLYICSCTNADFYILHFVKATVSKGWIEREREQPFDLPLDLNRKEITNPWRWSQNTELRLSTIARFATKIDNIFGKHPKIDCVSIWKRRLRRVVYSRNRAENRRRKLAQSRINKIKREERRCVMVV